MLRKTILFTAVLFLAFLPASVFAQDAGADPFAGQQTNIPLVQPGAPGTPQAVSQNNGFNLFPIVTCGTQAADTGPPDNGACTPCDLLDILENAVKFVAIGVTGPVAALLFIYAGFLFLFYGANPGMVSRAKTVMTNTVYGVAIILMSWIITVQLIKTVAPTSNLADSWYEFNCPRFLGGLGIAENLENPEPGLRDVELEIPEGLTCDEQSYAKLAETYNSNPDPEAVHPDTEALIDCLMEDPVIAAAVDENQLFTFERSKPICNIIRGSNVCGNCQHALYSCHYGGGTGDQGAQAVDFNFKGEKTGEPVEVTVDGKKVVVRNERDLAVQLIRAAKENSCFYKLLNFEGTHTHISVLSCDSDGQTPEIRGVEP